MNAHLQTKRFECVICWKLLKVDIFNLSFHVFTFKIVSERIFYSKRRNNSSFCDFENHGNLYTLGHLGSKWYKSNCFELEFCREQIPPAFNFRIYVSNFKHLTCKWASLGHFKLLNYNYSMLNSSKVPSP